MAARNGYIVIVVMKSTAIYIHSGVFIINKIH